MFDRTSLIIAASTFLFSLILFFSQNGEFLGSFAASVLATGLVWISYVILSWMWDALRGNPPSS